MSSQNLNTSIISLSPKLISNTTKRIAFSCSVVAFLSYLLFLKLILNQVVIQLIFFLSRWPPNYIIKILNEIILCMEPTSRSNTRPVHSRIRECWAITHSRINGLATSPICRCKKEKTTDVLTFLSNLGWGRSSIFYNAKKNDIRLQLSVQAWNQTSEHHNISLFFETLNPGAYKCIINIV